MTGDALERRCHVQRNIAVGVASRAGIAQARAPGRRKMNSMVGALQRLIAGRMAIHAARMGQHFSDLSEDRPRALRPIADALEGGGRLKLLAGWRLCQRGRETSNQDA
jgi:hypothetical protein